MRKRDLKALAFRPFVSDKITRIKGSYTEPHLATDNELVRNILLSVLSSLAKVEAQKIGERTRAGMAKAKAAGKHIGRAQAPGAHCRADCGRRDAVQDC